MSRPSELPLRIGHLQAVLTAMPDPEINQSVQHVAVVCHPHPLHQGTMNNKVVTTLARLARDLGLPVMRFNFRGVGESGLAWDYGRGEIEDAALAVNEMRRRYPNARVWLMGFSFGGFVAAQLSMRADLAGLVLIAPATSRFDMGSVAVNVPTFVAFNRDDDTVDPDSMQEWVDAQSNPLALDIQDSGGHFFHGQLGRLKRSVQHWLESQIG